MQGFDLLSMVLVVNVLLKIMFLDELIWVVLIHRIILLLVKQFVLFQVHEAQICAEFTIFRAFVNIIAVDAISVKVRKDEWHPVFDWVEHVVDHLKGYMIEGLLLNFSFALVFGKLLPIVFHFDELVDFYHYLDGSLFAQQIAL